MGLVGVGAWEPQRENALASYEIERPPCIQGKPKAQNVGVILLVLLLFPLLFCCAVALLCHFLNSFGFAFC